MNFLESARRSGAALSTSHQPPVATPQNGFSLRKLDENNSRAVSGWLNKGLAQTWQLFNQHETASVVVDTEQRRLFIRAAALRTAAEDFQAVNGLLNGIETIYVEGREQPYKVELFSAVLAKDTFDPNDLTSSGGKGLGASPVSGRFDSRLIAPKYPVLVRALTIAGLTGAYLRRDTKLGVGILAATLLVRFTKLFQPSINKYDARLTPAVAKIPVTARKSISFLATATTAFLGQLVAVHYVVKPLAGRSVPVLSSALHSALHKAEGFKTLHKVAVMVAAAVLFACITQPKPLASGLGYDNL